MLLPSHPNYRHSRIPNAKLRHSYSQTNLQGILPPDHALSSPPHCCLQHSPSLPSSLLPLFTTTAAFLALSSLTTATNTSSSILFVVAGSAAHVQEDGLGVAEETKSPGIVEGRIGDSFSQGGSDFRAKPGTGSDSSVHLQAGLCSLFACDYHRGTFDMEFSAMLVVSCGRERDPIF